jgi:glutathione S-transferase
MLLIGMLDSPFVRRVAISMKLLGFDYEHGNWSVGRDAERIRQYNPLLRVPTLVLDSGETLTESSAILDFLDQQVGAARALLPTEGAPRRQALQIMALAIGAAEKSRDAIYENLFRPAEKLHQPWLDRLSSQILGALGELEKTAARSAGDYWIGGRLSQADVSATCALSFMRDVRQLDFTVDYPQLERLRLHCESRPEFAATYTAFFPPKADTNQAT